MPGDRRQLAAVMLTDMVGYSALTQRDEALALQLAREQDQIVRSTIANFSGRAIKSLGDGVLAAFDSALDAVTCALEIQDGVGRRNGSSRDVSLYLRIGIHLGDLIHHERDVFGDAVNIVARIEPFAESGGICVSQQVFDQVHNKLKARFRSIGSPSLKNIDTPIQLFSITRETGWTAPTEGTTPRTHDRPPRIIVLPFANISPDPNDEYFADGMTEEIIERMAHVSGMRVIARTTAMLYKNSQATALEIGRTLQADMILECSVRKAGNRVRITAQLIESNSEEHLWASRYDRELDDIFAIRDDIAERITTAISEHLASRGANVALRAGPAEPDTTDMVAYTEFLQGRELYRKKISEETIRHAQALFESAVTRDPGFARARVGIADCVLRLSGEGSLPFDESVKRARDELTRALKDNESAAEAHSTLSGLLLGDDDIPGAAREARRAIDINPSYSDPYRWLAQIEAGDGNIHDAIRLLEEAYALDPLDINVIAFLGRAYFYAGLDERALEFWPEHESLVEFRTHQHRSEYYLGVREFARADGDISEMQRLRPHSTWVPTFRGLSAALQGDAVGARQCISELEATDNGGAVAVFPAGFIHHALGEADAFWDCMERALAQHCLPLLELRYSPLFSDLRSDARFVDLLERQRALSWGSL